MKRIWGLLFGKKEESVIPAIKVSVYKHCKPTEDQWWVMKLILAQVPESRFIMVIEPFDNMDPQNFSYQYTLVEFMLKMIDGENLKNLLKVKRYGTKR